MENFRPGLTLYQLEKEHIQDTLRFCGNNKVHAAKALGISTKTLYNKLESYEEQAKNDALALAEQKKKSAAFQERNKLPQQKAQERLESEEIKRLEQRNVAIKKSSGIQPAVKVSEKQPLPVPERKEIQEVLPVAPSRKSGT